MRDQVGDLKARAGHYTLKGSKFPRAES
jgi:hypothetical protein